MRPLLQRISFFVAAGALAAGLIFPQMATAATSTPIASGNILDTMRIFGANMGLSDTDPRIIIARLIRVAVGFVGIVMLLMILSSGAQFMVSGGDEEKVKGAKQTFYNAIIGIIIILSAYSIVAFAFHAFSAAGGNSTI